MGAGLEIQVFQRVVAQRGDEPPLTLEVHCHLVHPPLDMGEGYRLYQLQHLPLLGVRQASQDDQSKQHNSRNDSRAVSHAAFSLAIRALWSVLSPKMVYEPHDIRPQSAGV